MQSPFKICTKNNYHSGSNNEHSLQLTLYSHEFLLICASKSYPCSPEACSLLLLSWLYKRRRRSSRILSNLPNVIFCLCQCQNFYLRHWAPTSSISPHCVTLFLILMNLSETDNHISTKLKLLWFFSSIKPLHNNSNISLHLLDIYHVPETMLKLYNLFNFHNNS